MLQRVKNHLCPVAPRGRGKALFMLLMPFMLMFSSGAALAGTGVFSDQELRKQLDRLLYSEQYLLDVSYVSADGKSTSGTDAPFPGLAFIGRMGGALDAARAGDSAAAEVVRSGGIVDVLLVIDSGVSAERAALAREVVVRLADAAKIKNGMRLNLRRESMLRKPPPELLPAAQKAEAEKAAAKEKAGTPAADADDQKPARSFFDFIENRRDLALRTLFVIWAAVASLIALLIMISRRSKVPTDSLHGGQQAASQSQSGKSGDASGDSNSRESSRAKLAEHDALANRVAVQKLAAEIVEQAAKQPKKVSNVLAEWIGKSMDSARQAAILLRNCDVVTIENVCQHLHPSDIDKMMDQKTDEVEPFSSENRMVLEAMRTALARLAANKKFVDRPDPLEILKTVSDESLAKILSQQDLNSVAVVSAQIPAHRLQKYFSQLSEKDHQQLMAAILHLDAVKLEDLNKIAERFKGQLEALNEVLIDEHTIQDATKRVILATKDPRRQLSLAAGLHLLKPAIFKAIRSDVDLIIDLMFLGPRPMKVFLQSVDGEQLGAAISSVGLDRADIMRWADSMPSALNAAFLDSLGKTHDQVEVEKGWRSVRHNLIDLVANGLITRAECNYAKAQADDLILSKFNGKEHDIPTPKDETLYGAA